MMNSIKSVIAAIVLSAGAMCHAGVIAGPVSNEANGRLYYLLSPGDWDESEAEAASLGGHLVTLSDADEQTWVFDTFGNFDGTPRALWIGLTRSSEPGQWSWADGEPLAFANWAPGEPNGADANEDCVHLWPPNHHLAGLWNDAPHDRRMTDGWAPFHGVVEVVPTQANFISPALAFVLAVMLALALGSVVWAVYRRMRSAKLPDRAAPSTNTVNVAREQNPNVAQCCSRCGAVLTPNAPGGLCPRCLMALNLATETVLTGEASVSSEGAGGKSPPPPVASPAEIAKHFPHLEVLECLGRGGMGVVYKARQTRLNRWVALKILAPEKEQDSQFAARFTREAQVLALLNHPNIVGVHDFGEADGLYYLMMEFVDGVSLRHLIQSHKIAPEEALAIVPKICDALQYAHDQGVVHRDIKPENILLDTSGTVKIADFGIAKILGTDRSQPAITLATHVIGTPHYMAPEQVEKPHLVDHRADIYSLGVVFYEMLTGELPLGQFQPPSKKATLDARLDQVVLGALAKEPDRRYQHASEVKTDVETIATTLAPTEATTGHLEAVDGLPPILPESEPQVTDAFGGSTGSEGRQEVDQPRKRTRRTAVIAGLITMVLLLGLVGLGGIMWRSLRWSKSLLATMESPKVVAPGLTPAALNPPPLPPLPEIFLSDLKPLVFSSGWGQPGINRTVDGNPLTVRGKTYERGLGTHADGEAIFEIPADTRRFVAVVGLDDEVFNDEFGRGSVIFEVYGEADEPGEASVLLGKSPLLSPKTVRSWAFDLELESRFKRIDLIVSGGTDGNECDHADWVNAGFLKSPAAPRQPTIPPRDPQAGRNLIDLSAYYNAALDENWNDPFDRNNHLGELPTGLQTMAGTPFDVRGLIAVEQESRKHSSLVEGIPIGLKCRRLHFLHSAGNAASTADGTEIGRYAVHYANGERQDIPIRIGHDVVDWYEQPRERGKPLVIAWTGENPKSRRWEKKIRLFKSTWQNPLPGTVIQTIDFVALKAGPSPFLLAITAE